MYHVSVLNHVVVLSLIPDVCMCVCHIYTYMYICGNLQPYCFELDIPYSECRVGLSLKNFIPPTYLLLKVS